MSYDLTFAAFPDGIDPDDYLEQFEEAGPGPVDPEREAWKAELVAALQALEPELEPFEFDHAQIASSLGIPLEQAKREYRHVELNTDDGSGIQVMVEDHGCSITVPYWHEGDAAVRVLGRIGALAKAIGEHGLRMYDPQLGRIADPDADRAEMLRVYAGVMTKVPGLLGQVAAAPEQQAAKKPWWKFW